MGRWSIMDNPATKAANVACSEGWTVNDCQIKGHGNKNDLICVANFIGLVIFLIVVIFLFSASTLLLVCHWCSHGSLLFFAFCGTEMWGIPREILTIYCTVFQKKLGFFFFFKLTNTLTVKLSYPHIHPSISLTTNPRVSGRSGWV